MEGLEVRALRVAHGRRVILDRIGFGPLPPGSITAVLGANGSGKSTLLRALAGLHPAQGSIALSGHDLAILKGSARAGYCAYMPQPLPPPLHMQALETVLVALQAMQRLPRATALATALAAFDGLGIGALALRPMSHLSGGQRQLVGLAQVLARSPSLLLLDEPLSALDLRHRFSVMQALRRETDARQMVTLMVVHDLETALRHADQAILLATGRVLGAGPVRNVITPDRLEQAFGIRARVKTVQEGESMILVDGLASGGDESP